MPSPFHIDAPPSDFAEVFERDGCYVFPEALTTAGCSGLEAEMRGCLQTQAWGFGRMARSVTPHQNDNGTFGMTGPSMLVRGPVEEDVARNVSLWPAPGTNSFALIDDPFVVACLSAYTACTPFRCTPYQPNPRVVPSAERAFNGAQFHFCHCAYGFRLPGAKGMGFHQDHHHFNHPHPVNVAERNGAYIQALYYPSGFQRGDGSLRYIKGSHRDVPELGKPSVFNAASGRLPGQHSNPPADSGWDVEEPSLPPGSLVLINARMYHAVYDKLAEGSNGLPGQRVPYRSCVYMLCYQDSIDYSVGVQTFAQTRSSSACSVLLLVPLLICACQVPQFHFQRGNARSAHPATPVYPTHPRMLPTGRRVASHAVRPCSVGGGRVGAVGGGGGATAKDWGREALRHSEDGQPLLTTAGVSDYHMLSEGWLRLESAGKQCKVDSTAVVVE